MDALINNADIRKLTQSMMKNPEFTKVIGNVVKDPSILQNALQSMQKPGALNGIVDTIGPSMHDDVGQYPVSVTLSPQEVYFGCIKSIAITDTFVCKVRFPRGAPNGYQVVIKNIEAVGNVTVVITANMDATVYNRVGDGSDIEATIPIGFADAFGPSHAVDLPSMTVRIDCKIPVFNRSVLIQGGGLPKFGDQAMCEEISQYNVNYLETVKGTAIEISPVYAVSEEDFIFCSNARIQCGDFTLHYDISQNELERSPVLVSDLKSVVNAHGLGSSLGAPSPDLPKVLIDYIRSNKTRV